MDTFTKKYLDKTSFYDLFLRKFPKRIQTKVYLWGSVSIASIIWLYILFHLWNFDNSEFNLYNVFIYVLPGSLLLIIAFRIFNKSLFQGRNNLIQKYGVDKRFLKRNAYKAIRLIKKQVLLRILRQHKSYNEKSLNYIIQDQEAILQKNIFQFSLLTWLPLSILISCGSLLIAMTNLLFIVKKEEVTIKYLLNEFLALLTISVLIFGAYKIYIKPLAMEILNSKANRIKVLIELLKEIRLKMIDENRNVGN